MFCKYFCFSMRVFCILCGLLHVTVSVVPDINTQFWVTALYVDTQTDTSIATVTCEDPDGEDVTVTATINNPTFCPNCFILEPEDVPNGEYTLMYYPAVAEFDFDVVPEYSLTVTCVDDTGETTTDDILLLLLPNSPPVFDSGLSDSCTISNAKSVSAGTELTACTIQASDPNNDPIFYSMTTDPVTTRIELDRTSGKLTAVNDLSEECISQIILSVTINDGKVDNVGGPQVKTVTLDNNNETPEITNLPATSLWPEDTIVGRSLFTFSVSDDAISSTTITYTALPTSALSLFELTGSQLTLRSELDYEIFSLRTIRLLVTVTDGSCSSPTYTYTFSVTDVNEGPTISLPDNPLELYEGDIVLDPDWTTTDPELDAGDVLEYSILGITPAINDGDTPDFEIDPSTGIITSTINYDIDQDRNTATVTLTIQVKDSGDLTDRLEVILFIKDANDNAPIFDTASATQTFTLSECATLGTTLGSVVATDEDSDFEDNNVIEYAISGSGNIFTVTPSGSIIQTSAVTAGQTYITTVIATDNGQFPNTLSSLIPATIVVIGTACTTTTTTTATPATAATAATAAAATTTTTTTTASSSNTVDGNKENIWWIVIASLLGLVFLGMLTFLLLTRCLPYCANPPAGGLFGKGGMFGKGGKCGRGICRCDCRRKKVPKPKQPEITRIRPVEKFQPDAGNRGFWQETYQDVDYKTMPDRQKMPEPVDYDRQGEQPAPLQKVPEVAKTPPALEPLYLQNMRNNNQGGDGVDVDGIL